MKLCPKCEKQVTIVWDKTFRPKYACFNCHDYRRELSEDEIKAAEEEIREDC
jgi:hypothetical protein